jgi:hypothetical protein
MNAQTLALPRLSRPDLWPLQLGLVLAVLFAWVQSAAPGLAGVDGYYHLRMAALMRTDLTPEFVWLPLTLLNPAGYVDHHWLFHVLLVPFTGGDLIAGGRVAAAIFAAAALYTAGQLLRSQQVPFAGLWTILLFAASSAFLYRLSMARAQSLSLLWILAALYFMLHRRERWLIPLGVTYVWLYNAFPLLIGAAAVYVLAVRIVEGRWRWSPLAFAVLGILIGLVVNPFFPRNLVFIYHHLVAKLDPSSVPVGNEWYPYTTAQILGNSGLALLAFAAGALALGLNRERMSLPTAVMLGMSIATGLMLLPSRRFVEYAPAFSVLFCAFAWQPILSGRSFRPAAVGLAAAVVLAAALAAGSDARRSLASDSAPDRFAGAAGWLKANTPAGARVFQTDWDDFTRLFFYNTHNVYIVGLDPTYLQRADPRRYALWVDLTQGRGLDLSEAIGHEFGAQYVVSDLRHSAFLERAADDPEMQEVYRDRDEVVFQILDP